MNFDAAHVLIVLTPFLLAPLAGLLGGHARPARLLALVPAALTAYFAWMLAQVMASGAFTVTVPWAPRLGLSLAFHFDALGLLFALLITGMGALVVMYAVAYLGEHPLRGRFQLTLFAFMGSMLGVVLSDNVLLLFVFWELTGLTSFFLIGFDHERSEARRAALQALLVTSAGGLALLAAGVMAWQLAGTTSLASMRAGAVDFAADPRYVAMTILVLAAGFTKSAQFPFHFWLPNAMEAPTPVSAYLHSATMVKAGIYLVARMTPLLGGTALWSNIIIVVGAITMVGAAYRSLLETDLKRILAYTTVAALGAMMLLLGVGTRAAMVASLVYLAAHACYKGALFLVAGAVDHGTGTRDVRVLSGLARVMPATAAAGILAAASMAGIPLLFGFIAKEQFYTSVAAHQSVLLGLAVAASALMGAAGLTAGVAPFVGSSRRPADAHDVTPSLWLAPLLLALLGVIIGIAPFIIEAPVAQAANAITGTIGTEHFAIWHGWTRELLLSAVTLVITVALYLLRTRFAKLPALRALATERLYDGTLAGLDAASGRIAPALQSASLRSYVRVIVATAVVFLVTAYVRVDELPRLLVRTPPRWHEISLAALIMLAAISAARARSAMAAVLSLGTVGYGLALLYVLYGAPDLAATQFAVETLTVVLFVLVFYELRNFYDATSRWSRARDAILAGSVGLSIALLVLATSATGITSRLGGYFIDAAPSLGHGRNVVNVILVDFRALDTMGEITVLVTVAVGVRALLRIGMGRH